MLVKTEKILSSLRRRPWRTYVLWAVEGCSKLDGERAVAECRVSTWHSDGQRLCRPQTSSVAGDGSRWTTSSAR